jgi:hypothetical protein
VKKSSFVALLLIGATVLGATVLREPIAWAAQSVDANIVGPLDANGNVRVHEQGTAAVHEQGTANVKVTNSSLSIAPPAAIDNGGGSKFVCAGGECGAGIVGIPQATATALSIRMSDFVQSLTLGSFTGKVAARFLGPASGGNNSIVLAFDRPITFDLIDCHTASVDEVCAVSWVGNEP